MRAFAILAVAALGVSALAQDSIVWKPKVGDKSKHSMKIMSEFSGTDFEVNMVLSNEVKKVTAKEIVTHETMGDFKIFMGGQPMDAMGGPSGDDMVMEPTVMTRDPRGMILSIEAPAAPGMDGQDDGGMMKRFMRMNSFQYPANPVNVGDEWKIEHAAIPAEGIAAARSVFTYKGQEVVNKIPVYKIEFAFSELTGSAPMGATGTLWLRMTDGELVRLTAAAVNMQMGPMTSDGSLEMNLIE